MTKYATGPSGLGARWPPQRRSPSMRSRRKSAKVADARRAAGEDRRDAEVDSLHDAEAIHARRRHRHVRRRPRARPDADGDVQIGRRQGGPHRARLGEPDRQRQGVRSRSPSAALKAAVPVEAVDQQTPERVSFEFQHASGADEARLQSRRLPRFAERQGRLPPFAASLRSGARHRNAGSRGVSTAASTRSTRAAACCCASR